MIINMIKVKDKAMKYLIKLMPVFPVLLLSGCATIFNGGDQDVRLSTVDDKKVKVMVTNAGSRYESVLPATISAVHDIESVSVMVKDGDSKNAVYVVPKNITPSFWANVFFPPGFLLDLATGNMWKYPSNYTVPIDN